MEEKSQMKESFAAKVILFLILLICMGLLYPTGWNLIAKVSNYPHLEGNAFLRWDLVLGSKDACTLAISAVVVLFVVTLYLGKMIDSSRKKGLVASGTEYGSARFATDDELHQMFYTKTVDSAEKTKRIFHIWRYPKNSADTKF